MEYKSLFAGGDIKALDTMLRWGGTDSVESQLRQYTEERRPSGEISKLTMLHTGIQARGAKDDPSRDLCVADSVSTVKCAKRIRRLAQVAHPGQVDYIQSQ